MFKEPKPYKARGTFMAFTPILLPRFPAGYHIFSQWTLGPCILCVYLHLESSNLRCYPLAARGVEVVSNRKPRLSIAFPRSNLFFFCSASFPLWLSSLVPLSTSAEYHLCVEGHKKQTHDPLH